METTEESGYRDSRGSVEDWTVLSREQVPWPSLNREMKLLAVAKLPELLDKIIAEARRLDEVADEASKKLAALGED